MAVECDFDELAALLEEDSDEEFEQTENVTVKTEDAAENGNLLSLAAESSDDDIDDDELDRLAGLVEEENEIQEEAKVPVSIKRNIKKEPDEGKTDVKREAERLDESKDITEQISPIGVESRPSEGESKLDDGESKPNEDESMLNEEEEEDSEEDNEDVKEKINQMYAMIQQLQSQVTKKSQKKSPEAVKGEPLQSQVTNKSKKKSPEAVKGEPSNVANKKPKLVKAERNEAVKPSKAEDVKKTLTAKLKLIEDDIFSKSTQDPTPSSSASGSNKKAANTTDKAEKPVDQEVKSERLYTVKEAQKQIFGSESDDSDWEGLDGEKPSQYNQSGKDIKQIMKKMDTTRVAHSAAYDLKAIANRKPSWGKKDVYKQRTAEEGCSSSYTRSVSPPRSVPLPAREEEDDRNVMRDSFSELRIVNPRISSTQLKMRMEGRQMFQMSTLHRRVNTSDMEKDWVTIGVLVQKSEPKMSSAGKQYSIWTLSDLKDCQRIVKMFLFGDVYTQHWKTSIGSVLGFLNPNPMSNSEKYQNKTDDVTLCVDNSNKVMFMGQSKDFGYCKSFTKAGRKCTNFTNKYKAEFCEYHISKAYKTASAKRGDLQGGTAGHVPGNAKPDLKAMVLANTNGTVFYGGQSFSSNNTKQKKKGVSITNIASHEKSKGPLKRGQVTTLSLFEIRPEDAEKLEQFEEKKKQQDKKAFCEMLATPTVGSMNLVKHLLKDKKDDKGEKKQLSFQSVTAQDMFKTRAKMAKPGYSAVGSQSTVQVASPTPLPSTSLPRLNVPQLGRGFSEGGSIFLDSPTTKKPLGPSKAELLKKRAIEKIKKKGGVKAVDPNAVKAKSGDDKQERIKKRLCEDSGDENEKNAENVRAKKKPRLTGGVDLDDPEIQKLLKKKSKHDNLLLEVEQEKQDEYFDILEKKEKMETKMGEITKVKVRAVSCKKCEYTSFKAADRCREERHPLVTHEATKRFFVCQHCNHRTYSLDRLPKTSCNCGKNAWQRTSMHKEKKGPKLESEELNLRGEEIKFLNSMI